MNNGYEIAAAGEPPPRAHLYDYLIILARHRWKIVAFVFIGVAAVAAYAMVAPMTFTASATLMPPEQQKGIGFGDLLSKGVGFGDFGSIGKNTSAEIFVKILASRTLTDSLIDRFDLTRRYGLADGQRELARQQLQGSLVASSDREGMITINYHAGTGYMATKEEQREAARFAAEIVNGAIALLDQLNREKMVTSARRSREFIGRMRTVKRREMDRAQQDLLEFQQANRAIALDQQVEASVSALADIQSQIQRTELELLASRAEMTDETLLVHSLEARLRELNAQRARLESGRAGSAPFALDMQAIPALSKDYATLKLDLEVATQVYTYLEAQYHQEEVQEARDLPTVSALDVAVPPEFRTSPRRAMMLIVAVPILFVVAILAAFILDAITRQARGVDQERAMALREALGRNRRASRRIAGAEQGRN